jgi:hypothetical protein
MKVFYDQRTFSEFPEKDKERQRSTLVFVLIAKKNVVSFTMASNFHCNFELELADDFMEITETLSAVTNDGAKVSALYLLLFFVSVLFDECPCRTIDKLSHIHIHTHTLNDEYPCWNINKLSHTLCRYRI